jgi:TPR repeat protein
VNSTQTGSAFASAAQSLPAQEESAAKHLDDEEITRLVNLGMAFLKSGDLSAARPLFLRAADAGSANAAFMLGETFDPLVMQRLGVVGIEPDVVRARRWYEKAEELGSNVAARELAKLSAFRD